MMHELSITQNILEIALRHSQQAQVKRITDLYLVIGQFSSVVDDSVQFYWDMISAGTIAEGARLHFERIPARLVCRECQTEYTLDGRELTGCPHCDSIHVEILAGKEFRLDSIAVES